MKKALIVLVTVVMSVSVLVSCGNDPFFHIVEFDSNGGTAVEKQIVRNGEKAAEPEKPTKEGTEFLGWYDGDEKFTFDTVITKDYKLKARWSGEESGSSGTTPSKPVCTVTFKSEGGTAVKSQTVEKGKKAALPANPTHTGWGLLRWSTTKDGTEAFSFDTAITENITLYAVWQKTYAVGDTGPGSGMIYYDVDADNDTGNADNLISSECGWRFLESKSTEIEEEYYFTTLTSSSRGTETGIGAGKVNTEEKLVGDSYPAARACSEYSTKNESGIIHDDWFLPSIKELSILLNSGKVTVETSTIYMSSSEAGSNGYQSFYSQYLDDIDNQTFDTTASIFPVRRF